MGIKQKLLVTVAALNTACAGLFGHPRMPVDVPMEDVPWEDHKGTDGVTVIRVGFTGEAGKFPNGAGQHDYAPPTPEEQAAIRETLKAYSEVLDIDFIPVALDPRHPDLDKVDLIIRTAVIDFAKSGGLFSPEITGTPEGITLVDDDIADMILKKGEDADRFRDSFKHELGHVLGLGHASGPKWETVMHPMAAGLAPNTDPAPAPSDFRTLVKYYGARDKTHER